MIFSINACALICTECIPSINSIMGWEFPGSFPELNSNLINFITVHDYDMALCHDYQYRSRAADSWSSRAAD